MDHAERLLVSQRIQEPLPLGKFDLLHLRAIHRHLFQDIYDWAGELRTVEISKGTTQSQPKRFIETGIADVHRLLVERDFLMGLSRTEFAEHAGQIYWRQQSCPSFSGRKRQDAAFVSEATRR